MNKLVLFLCFATLMASCTSKKSCNQNLYVLHAGGGQFVNGQLVLKDVSPSISFFANSSDDFVGIIGVDFFVTSWNKEILGGPTKVSFVCKSASQQSISDSSLELNNPRYNAFEKTLIFDVLNSDKKKFHEQREMEGLYLYMKVVEDDIEWGTVPNAGGTLFSKTLTQGGRPAHIKRPPDGS